MTVSGNLTYSYLLTKVWLDHSDIYPPGTVGEHTVVEKPPFCNE